MLKLEKSGRSAHINITFREKEKIFNPLFFKAFFCAILLHLTAFSLFHVQPFALSSNYIYPPVRVNSEHEPLLMAPSLLIGEVENDLFPIPPKMAGLPPSNLLALSPLFEQVLDLDLIPFPSFDVLEQRYWPLPPSPPVEKAAIRLFISGELADHPIVNKELQKIILLDNGTTEPLYVSYQVKAEEKTGTIFWHQRLNSSGSDETDTLTEKIMLESKFQTPFIAPLLTGWVHFVVYPATQDK
ncbi:MAG: hypothetical protein H0V82_08655 [Candidatus Protochlamydia sp.]|nr:hypothetical protein [Candidatus Protochlamydia sp.]